MSRTASRRVLLFGTTLPADRREPRSSQKGMGLDMKKIAALATILAGFAASAGLISTVTASASTVCASASAQVQVNGTDVVNQSVSQCE